MNEKNNFLNQKRKGEIFKIVRPDSENKQVEHPTQVGNAKSNRKIDKNIKPNTIKELVVKQTISENWKANVHFENNTQITIRKGAENENETLESLTSKVGSNIKQISVHELPTFEHFNKKSINKYDYFFNAITSLIRGENSAAGKNYFLEFKKTNPWDYFEHMIITRLSSVLRFDFFQSFILLYLYDNFKKLKDSKTIDTLNNRFAGLICSWGNLKNEMIEYYKYKNHRMKKYFTNFKEFECDGNKIINDLLTVTLIYDKISNMDELDLTQHYILSENAQLLFSALKSNVSIKKLGLNSNKIGEEGMYSLGRALLYNKNILELDLSYNLLTDDSVSALNYGINDELVENERSYLFLAKKIGLKSLSLIKQLLFGIRSPSLTKLNLSNNSSLTYKSGVHIGKYLINFPKLLWLNLSRNNLDSRGLTSIMDSYLKLIRNKLSQLETLIAFQIRIEGDEVFKKLSEVLRDPNCTLKSLVLSDNKFNPDHPSTFEFFHSLGINTSLKELILINCEISNEYGDGISHMLLHNETLEKLSLYNNKIDDPEKFKNILRLCSEEEQIVPDATLFFNVGDTIEVPNRPKRKVSKLKDLDISKNKCKFSIDNDFLTIIKNIKLETLDISQNFELPTEEEISKAFKEVTNKVQAKTKIIY